MCSQLVCVFEKNEQDVIIVYLFGISVDVDVFSSTPCKRHKSKKSLNLFGTVLVYLFGISLDVLLNMNRFFNDIPAPFLSTVAVNVDFSRC